jgi:hypothetical protein
MKFERKYNLKDMIISKKENKDDKIILYYNNDAKEIIYPESKEQEEIIYRNNDNNVIANMEKLKDYQFRKRIFKNRTFQSPHPINSFSTGNPHANFVNIS